MSTMRVRSRAASAFAPVAVALAIGLAPWVGQAESNMALSRAVADIVRVLESEGLIDEATGTEILARNHAAQASVRAGAAAGILDGWDISGDLRLRNEQFWYDDDFTQAAGASDPDDRNRYRYRARFNLMKKLNDFVSVGFRFSSGATDHRSTNQSLGDSDNLTDTEFGRDPITIDRAYVDFVLPTPDGMKATFRFGKMGNPYVDSFGPDYMFFDHDLSPEGGNLLTSYKVSEDTTVYLNTGFMFFDEMSSSADPKMFAFQLGGETTVAEGVEVAVRGTWYEFRSLDASFIARGAAGGNLADAAFLGRGGAYDEGEARFGEFSASVEFKAGEQWPILLYGQVIQNFNAEDLLAGAGSVAASEEDTAWGVGFEAGDSKKLVKLGFGYFHVEANSVPGNLTDSDLFDGLTNREGWTAFVARDLMKNVQLKFTLFDGDEIAGDFGDVTFSSTGAGSDRMRLQSDIQIEF